MDDLFRTRELTSEMFQKFRKQYVKRRHDDYEDDHGPVSFDAFAEVLYIRLPTYNHIIVDALRLHSHEMETAMIEIRDVIDAVLIELGSD